MPDRGRLASRVSVVIPVLNAARTLPLLFDALDRLAPAPLEVLLVDNGSTDGGPTLMRSYAEERVARGVRLLEEKKRGAASARNTGIRAAKGEIVAFTDSDCSPDPAWLENVMLSFDDSSVGAVAGRVVGAPGTTLLE
ncbi:MAG: glycosyltransferase family A protein, partial [Vicinamibacteria bacterium]